MKIISVFNNKGGVGKTTLMYNTAYALAELGKKILVIDCDPQCNMSLNFLTEDRLEYIWRGEEEFITEGYQKSRESSVEDYEKLIKQPRSLHFILKPSEEGIDDPKETPLPLVINDNLHLIPGRLTMYLFEDFISKRWNDLYSGNPLAIRTVTKIRKLCEELKLIHQYDYVLIDTSPSLGALNKVIISFADHFLIPCNPDKFSLYGIKNIGHSMTQWFKDIAIVYSLLSDNKRTEFPKDFVQFIGFCIYKAKRYSASQNEWELAQGHYNLAQQVPHYIEKYISSSEIPTVNTKILSEPIGGTSIMHFDNTHPSLSQQLHVPMWLIPTEIDKMSSEDFFGDTTEYKRMLMSVRGNKKVYEKKQQEYQIFAKDLINRLEVQ